MGSEALSRSTSTGTWRKRLRHTARIRTLSVSGKYDTSVTSVRLSEPNRVSSRKMWPTLSAECVMLYCRVPLIDTPDEAWMSMRTVPPETRMPPLIFTRLRYTLVDDPMIKLPAKPRCCRGAAEATSVLAAAFFSVLASAISSVWAPAASSVLAASSSAVASSFDAVDELTESDYSSDSESDLSQ